MQRLKVIIFTLLLVTFVFLLIVPTNAEVKIYKGSWSAIGNFGPGCKCGDPLNTCTCIILE